MSSILLVAVRIHADMKMENYRKWAYMISDERNERIAYFKFDVDRIRALISELVARKCISDQAGISFRSLEFHRGSHGKPYVNLEVPLAFNWSHSGDWILFAMDSEPVGVDVEVVHPVKEMDLARRFFDAQEVAQLNTMPAVERKKHFFKLWSLKESYIKWKGTGLSTELDSFRFLYNKHQELLFSNNHEDSCYFHTIHLDSRRCSSLFI
ncbi:4'-phosphopantetheinyl transferase family protein [Gracilibacillus saliphilus]|uniref:4'-phosphopantetheinyl transferase family protein n=1 Tax=Gracilibacillus saliphilus TaxID=543890 RepID=UPI0013D25942|nr:4'-phosphopantetheinyl transferase superfamily protein [Gracilibacillus saliphilus]